MSRSIFALLLYFVACVSASAEPKYTKNVAILIYEGVEILDFAGPAEVFASAGRVGASDQQRAFHVYTVSRTRKPIVSQGFIDITPDYSIDDSPKPDIIVIPGGASNNVEKDAAFMEWVKKSARDAENVVTVCTGAFIAGKAGLLEGVDATTFYNAIPGLAKDFPNTRVIPGRRFVDSGKVITTAGVSAGIDGSLHFVARTLGKQVADQTAEYMEYKWSPESYLSSKYPLLNPRLDDRGRMLQRASISVREGNANEATTIYRSLIAVDSADAEAWLNLARILHGAERYKEAIEANEHAARSEAHRGLALFNMACEYAITGQRDKAIETAKKAIEAGYRARWAWEDDTDLVSLQADPRFKALVASL